MSKEPPTVVFLSPRMPQYRRPFFEELKKELSRRGVRLIVVHGTPPESIATKGDEVDLPWATKVPTRRVRFGRRSLYWYPWWRFARRSDLTIVGQAASDLSAYPLLLQQVLRRPRVALVGHGRNLDTANASRVAETLKRLISKRAHWWFTHTTTSEQIVSDLGFPRSRITVFNNAIDTRRLMASYGSLPQEEVERVRLELGIEGADVGLFVGGMTAKRRLGFLLDALQYIRALTPEFEAVLIGAGPEQKLVEDAAARNQWIHYVGPKFDEDRLPYFALSKLFLMPGALGLAILDAFALGVPPVTVADAPHGPEIAYLENNVNGVIMPHGTGPKEYAHEARALLREGDRHRLLVKGGKSTAESVTLENMVLRFADGVEAALFAAPSRATGRR